MNTPNPGAKLTHVDPATFTPHFEWKRRLVTRAARNSGQSEASRESAIFCEGVDLADAATKFGTPLYLYSRNSIVEAFQELGRGLGSVPHTLCFAMKANSNLSILKMLAGLGSGFDIVSAGELEQLQRIGVRGDRIVFSGVGKSREEMRSALQYRASTARRNGPSGILLFNVESEAELEVLLEESARHVQRGGQPPAASIRVNPDVLAGGHPKIATGLHEHKFGVAWSEARRLYLRHKNSQWIRWQGISAHIGSQIVKPQPFAKALKRVISYVKDLSANGIPLRYLDFGGGLGVRYTNEKIPTRTAYAKMIAQLVRPLKLHLLLEPGRTIIAPAGVLLTRVQYIKRSGRKNFVIVDAGMTELIRPSLYGAIHPITRTSRNGADSNAKQQRVDVVGPVCETGDCFLRNWPLEPVRAGELLAVWTTGAYGMSLANNYNGRPRAAEVLVNGKRTHLIRRRETQADLLRTDVLS